MNILFLTHYFPPEVNAPASRTLEHARVWVEAGCEVTVVTCVPNCPTGVVFNGYKNRFRRQVEVVDGIKVVRVWTYLAANAGTGKRILNYVSYLMSAVWTCLFMKRPDVVVATSPQFFCGWAGVLVSWLKWKPFVLEVRDLWPDSITAVGAMQNSPLLRVLERLEKWMYRAANLIVTVGPGYQARILEKTPNVKIEVVTNGVDPEQFAPQDADEEFLSRWNLQGKFVCSYVGTIGMAHGLEVVIEAAKRLREANRDDIAFLLVGDGARRKELEQRVADEGLESRVVFTGMLPKSDVPKVLASSSACLIHLTGCDLFGDVIPSKIFEIMAMQRPMIMGVKGVARDIVLQAEAGIPMEPDSVEELVECTQRLADEQELRDKLGRNARTFVIENYSRQKLAMNMLESLQSVS